MSPYQQEQLDIVRRTAERGKTLALSRGVEGSRFVDVFQHMLDELKRINTEPT